MSSITLIVNEVKRRAEALTCNSVAGKPEGRNGNNKTVSAISLFRYAEGVNLAPYQKIIYIFCNQLIARIRRFLFYLLPRIKENAKNDMSYTEKS